MPEAPEPIKDTRVVTLTSKDGVPIELPASAAARSMFIKEALLEGHDDDDDDDADEDLKELAMDIPRVRSEALGHIVEFLKHYDEEPMREISVPLEGNTFEEAMDQPWYNNFVADENMPEEMLFEVLTGANYMAVQPLLDLCCLKVTFQLQGKTAEEIRTKLNLPELTPEEEAEARQEHPWIFEEAG